MNKKKFVVPIISVICSIFPLLLFAREISITTSFFAGMTVFAIFPDFRTDSNYAFETLNFNRVQLHVSIENDRAVKVYQNMGFQIEGTFRRAMFFKNHYIDFYLMAVLKKDWLKKKHSIPPEK